VGGAGSHKVLIDSYSGGAERVSCICSEAYGARLSAVGDPNIYVRIIKPTRRTKFSNLFLE